MNNLEILSPVGSFESLIAAVQKGANAVYFGGKSFNARNYAQNFDDNMIKKSIIYAKTRGVKTYLTLNTLIKDEEIPEVIKFVNKVYSYGIDALIVQDLGIASVILKYFPDLPLHASTQMSVHNLEGVRFLENLGFKRVVLARELSLKEISYICKNTNIEIECFVHGSLCVSHSGQCLFSSMIGQRSGNRGKCAQPCRMLYKLLKDNTAIKEGYLLSPKDLCTIEYFDKLKNSGITSFKIEGRLKQSEYVGLVTNIYSRALKGEKVSNDDIINLAQMFNRGGFTTYNLFNKQDVIYPIKPKNLGTYLGKILSFDKDSSLISIKLEQDLDMGDGVETLNMECSTVVTEMLFNGKHIRSGNKGQIICIGPFKGNLCENLEVYRTSSKMLNSKIQETFNGKEYTKVNLNLYIEIKSNQHIKCKINNIFEYTSDILPQESINKPLTKDSLINQLCKTNDYPFLFENYNIILDDNLFLPLSSINSLRNDLLQKYLEFIEKGIGRKSINEKLCIEEVCNNVNNTNIFKEKKIYLYLNKIDESSLTIQKVDGVYIPYRLYLDFKTKELVEKMCNIQNVYIAIPNILHNINEKELEIELPKNIHGILLSNISQLDMFKNTNIDIHLDYQFNVFNRITYSFLKNYSSNISNICISPELNEKEINCINSNATVICYGRIKNMTINNCIVKDCQNCPNTNYSLIDRLNYTFPIITDNYNCTTNIYNSKILAFDPNRFNISNIRFDFTTESTNEIKSIISMFKTGNIPTGDNYTNGNYKKEV